ncbi:hypothetical protein HK102_002144 [Quaeritorhiza haematococci]|nr:hypothetical protein HK102_002144 [Quaeritorhiza haematococci]
MSGPTGPTAVPVDIPLTPKVYNRACYARILPPHLFGKSTWWTDFKPAKTRKQPHRATVPIAAPTRTTTTLKILTYNIWFDALTLRLRTPHLIQILEEQSADIVCLQECTSEFLRALASSSFVRSTYIVSDISADTFKSWYGVVVMVKRKEKAGVGLRLEGCVQRIFSQTRMGRAIVGVRVRVEGVGVVMIGTSHFESGEEDGEVRRVQFKEATGLVDPAFGSMEAKKSSEGGATPQRPVVGVLCGDFNIHDDEAESATLASELGWRDAYIDSPESKGVLARMGGATRGTVKVNGKDVRVARLDRILFRVPGGAVGDEREATGRIDVKAERVKYLGEEAIDPGMDLGFEMFPSDHLGVCAELRIEAGIEG